jgi:TldD protein
MKSRRTFLKTSALTAIATGMELSRAPSAMALSRPLSILAGAVPIGSAPHVDDPQVRELAMHALDAARSAGATYADVRLTVTRTQTFLYGRPPSDMEVIGVGVRALFQGCWGFVASPVWTLAEMARLGKDAVAQARDNAWPGTPRITLANNPQPASGTWAAPVKRDPFDVAIEEKLDYIHAVMSYASTFRNTSVTSRITFERQQRAFASTDGAFCTQTVYNTLGNNSSFSVSVADLSASRNATRSAPIITPTSAGYEIFTDADLMGLVPQLYEEAREMLSAEPATPGRYEIVFDGYATATLVDQTLGVPLEIDRVLGLEANAGGTSYLAPIEETLGSSIGPSALTLTANRSQAGGAATVKWDDDGVAPETFTLVRDGTIVDYETTREHAPTLATWYRKEGSPVQSHGCAASGSAMDIPLVHPPNLQMQPADTGNDMEQLIANVKDGYAVFGCSALMDQQHLTGRAQGLLAYRIKQGKRVGTVDHLALLFRSKELWKNLVAVGSPDTVRMRGTTTAKGQPVQQTSHSISAPAVLIKDMSVITT